MAFLKCCSSCDHCIDSQSSWCALRKINIPKNLESLVFCHHWTKQEPYLPRIEKKKIISEKQLELTKIFVNKTVNNNNQ